MHFISKPEKVEHVSDINVHPDISNPESRSENSLGNSVIPERVEERDDEREPVDPPSKRVKV